MVLPEGCTHFISLSDVISHADYGSRSKIMVRWFFALDAKGVMQKYRVGNRGNLRDGSYPDPSKTKLIWEAGPRKAEPVVETPKVEINPGRFLGAVGEKIEFTAVIKRVNEFTRAVRFSYYDSGVGYVTNLMTDDGATVVYFGALRAEVGDTVKIRATIKDLQEYKGVCQTVIQRPKLVA